MAIKKSNERLFCWELVLRTNRVFRISQIFAPPEAARRVLPLYALFAAIEEICSNHTEADVARRKLEWWRRECARFASSGSDHPIFRELSSTGANRKLPGDSLSRLLDDAESRLDEAAPSALEDLRARCRRLSQPQMELELSILDDVEASAHVIDGLGAPIGLAQLLRESVRRGFRDGFWWLPLGMMAGYGVKRSDVGLDPVPEAVSSLLSEVIAGVMEQGSVRNGGFGLQDGGSAGLRHLLVYGRLQAQALQRLHSKPPGEFSAELSRIGPRQVYHAWRAARSINRP